MSSTDSHMLAEPHVQIYVFGSCKNEGTMQEAPLSLAGTARRSNSNEYVQLKQLVKQRGFLDQQPIYYTWKFLFTVGLLLIGVGFLILVQNFWLVLLTALYMGFVSMQFGLLGHDIGHR